MTTDETLGTPPTPQDWRDLADTCRETAHRLNATAGGPLDDVPLLGLLAELADRSRRLGLAAPPLAWIRGDAGEGLDYSFPGGARKATPLWLLSPAPSDGLPGLLRAVAGAAGVTVRRQHGDHDQTRREAAAALQSWIRHAERKAAELTQAETSTALTAPPGQKTSEGTGAGSQGDKTPDDGTNRYAALKKLAPRDRKAYLSYLYAEAKGAKGDARRLEDYPAWEWLKENGIDVADDSELAGYDLPDFPNWWRYLRTARKATGEQKHKPRTARTTGRSIIRSDELERQKPDDE